MTEKIRAVLDVITERVFSYRPADKGLAAKKTERRVKRAAKKEAHNAGETRQIDFDTHGNPLALMAMADFVLTTDEVPAIDATQLG